MMNISVHILDMADGRGATEVPIRLEREISPGQSIVVFVGITLPDGRRMDLLPKKAPMGIYRMIIDSGAYFARRDIVARFPRILITFRADQDVNYHLPVYIGPHAFQTYRGS
uniref:5-hydroxyisourate hydrolase n=1 Tax=Candidatus Kentrum sp. LFY TaxID=2126342 RepID=A0A450UMB6_9GAMM|nr:MAG: 5-hydroxyisourate hydrolase [Candidatus Kentron sp. LFY]